MITKKKHAYRVLFLRDHEVGTPTMRDFPARRRSAGPRPDVASARVRATVTAEVSGVSVAAGVV